MKQIKQQKGLLLAWLLLMSIVLPAMADSRSGKSGGVSWSADFSHDFENNKGHSYGWWTGVGFGNAVDRLCFVEVGNGAMCTTADPGFDIKLGVGVKHYKDMEYQKSGFDFYLVKADGTKVKLASSEISRYDSECYRLDNSGTQWGFVSHPQLWRTGSGQTSYEHKIGARITLTKKSRDEGYTRLLVKGYSQYYKNPFLRAKVWMNVRFEYYINLKAPKFEIASEPGYSFTSPTELTLKFSNENLSRINKSQRLDTSESTRLGLRHCGIESNSVSTNYSIYVQARENGEWKTLYVKDINVDGYDPKSVTLEIPADKPIRLQYYRSTTNSLRIKTAYYRDKKWTNGVATINQISERVLVEKVFDNAKLSAIKASFNQVSGKMLISWEKNSSFPSDYKFHVYRTLLYDNESLAGNREELGSTKSNTFEDSNDRGMIWGRKYRYEVAILADEWDIDKLIPKDSQPISGCNFAECIASTTPVLDFHITQDMEETEKIKLDWEFSNIPEMENDLLFRIHRISQDGNTSVDYGGVSARRRDGKASFIDEKPASNCEIYRYLVQLDLFDNSLHFFSDTLTARITACTTLTDLAVTKGNLNEGIRVNWKANQVGTDPTVYKVKRRFIGTTEWIVVHTVQGTAEEYTYLDTDTEKGRYYEYCVEAYGANCDNNDQPLLTDSRIEPGFENGTGTISGRVSFETGTAVDNVKVNLLRSDDEQVGQNYTYARQILEAGKGVAWNTTADNVRELMGATKEWSMQMWVRPDDINNTERVYLMDVYRVFSVFLKRSSTNAPYSLYWLRYHGTNPSSGSFYSLKLCDNIPVNEYTHITLTHNGDTLSAYLNGQKVYTWNLSHGNYDGMLDSYAGSLAVSFGHNNFTGCLDEVRLWNRELSDKDVAGNYGRMLGGREDGLKLYWPFDEGLDSYSFDISRTSGVANNNHPDVSASKSTEITPSSTQLGYFGMTNELGEYVIRGIPFKGSGTSYTVSPELGTHQFSPSTRTGFISNSSMALNNYDFTDISSFKVSGRIYYEGTDVPVDSVRFSVDGTPCMAEGELIYTNAEGEYTISVPIGFHYITASRAGHTFVGNGRYPVEKGSTFEFRTDQTINFTDNTLVHLGGRLTGGAEDGKQPLGYGVSKNTIGQATLQLEALDYPQCRLNVVEQNNGLVTAIVNNEENLPVESISEQVNSESWRAGGDDNAMRYIYIKTDPKTGEFSAMLPPIRYRVSNISFEHNSDLDNASVFNNLNAIDLSKVQDEVKPDTLWDESHTSYEPLFRCNKTLRLTYRSPVEFDVYQIGAPKNLIGQDSVIVTVTGQDALTLPVATVDADDNVNYLYGYPIFEQNEIYEFKVRVFEPYINYDIETEGQRFEVALADSVITIDNEMGDNVMVSREIVSNDSVNLKVGDIVHLDVNQLKLDSLGTAVYKWKASFPNLTAPFTRTMNIFTTVDGAVYGWKKESLEGIVFGCIPTGNNFVTTGPDKVIMVLRDPPGSNSSAVWQRDTIKVINEDLITFQGFTENVGWKFGTGMKSSIYTGVGVMTNATEVQTQYHDEIGEEVTVEYVYGDGSTNTTITTNKVNTSNNSGYVGSKGDVYIGMSKNYLFGGAFIVGLVKQTDGSYKLDMEQGMSVSTNFNTMFRYTQNYIENTQIPNTKKLRNQLLTYVSDVSQIPNKVDRPMFFTTLPPEDPRYGSCNTDSVVWGAQAVDIEHSDDGPSYVMCVPDDFQGVDSVAFYNNSIANWIECMRKNEEDKVKAFSDNKYFKGNVSWDRGTTLNHSVSTSEKEWETDGVNSSEKIYAKLEYGAEGVVSQIKTFTYQVTNLDVHQRTTYKYTDTDEYKELFGYTLDDANRSAALSVDVFDSPAGWSPIFRTRGGQTRCPYEGEEKTKYYKPVTTLNYATMKIDNPKVSIPNNMILNVPSGREASLEVIFTNESETAEPVLYPILSCLDNPNGLHVYVDGDPIGSEGLTMPIPYGVQVKKTLTLRQTDTSILNYDNIRLALFSPCIFNSMYDDASFTIHFTPSAPQATVSVNKTVINGSDVLQSPDKYLTVTAKDYDLNFKGFKSLRVKYRFIGDNNWITDHEFFNGNDNVPVGGLQEGQSLLDDKSSVSHSFALPLVDGHYMVCVETTSMSDGNEVTWQSEEIEVVKDTHGPMLLGQTYPNTGILTPSDDIHIKFNEPIRANYLTKAKNFSLIGDLNESPIDHYVSLQLNGSPLRYEGYVPVSNTHFAASMWLYRQSGGTIFAHASADSQIALSVDDNGYTTLTVDGQQFAGKDVTIPVNQWVFITTSYVHTSTENYYDAQMSTDEETLTLFDHQVVPEYNNVGQLVIGDGLKGAMHDLSVWAAERTPVQQREYMWKSIPVFKDGLVGYWRMNEGHGTQVTDCARGRNIYLETESWNLNNENLAAHLDGTTYIKADVSTEALSEDDNYMLSLWFKGDKDANANSSLFSLTDRMSVDFDSNHDLLLRTYRSESSINSDGQVYLLTDVNYSDGQWHHFAINVRRGTSANFYIDGQPVKTMNETEVPAFAASSLFLGARERAVDNELKPDMLFKGDIDEFAVWKATVDGTSLSESRYYQYDSISPALLVYYPMEHKYKDANGMIHAEFSLQSGKKSTNGELRTAQGPGVVQALNAPPLKTMATRQNLDFEFTASEEEIYIKLKTLPSRMHGNLMSFTVMGVPDVYGNLSETITWTARANYSTLKWDTWGYDYAMVNKDYNTESSTTATLVNTGPESCNFSLSSLPSWIKASKTEGTIGVGQKEEINFTITASAPLGTHYPIIYASNNDGILEPLTFRILVYGNSPEWFVDQSRYENSMNIIGQVYVKDKIATQEMTQIYAFIGDECRGMAQPQLMTSRDAFFTNLVVYGNDNDVNKPITFRIYDGERGLVYTDVPAFVENEETTVKYINNMLLGNYDKPVKWNAHDLVEQVVNWNYNWNWISLYVQPLEGKSSPDDVLGDSQAFFSIKDKPGHISFLRSEGWEGSFTSMKPGEMYKLRMTSDYMGKTIRGAYINPKETALTIYKDYNWIGSLSIFSLSLNDAFADLKPLKGDYVIAKNGVAFYNGFQWEGTLQTILPGEGYIYYSTAEETKTFHFPDVETSAFSNTALFDDDETALWTPFTPVDHHQFSDNMNVIATLTDGYLPVDTAWVAAFIDGECRGVTRAINGIYYIPVAGNPEETGKPVQFRTYYDGELKGIVETSQFVSDNIEGDPDEPMILTIGNALGVDDLVYTGIDISPAKTQRKVYVRSQMPLRSVEIYSTVGALLQSIVADNENVDLDLLTLPDGLYIVKAVDKNGNECVKRVIKTTKIE